MDPKGKQNRKWLETVADIEGAVLLEGFDEAIAGVVSRGGKSPCAAYDQEIMLEVLLREGLTMEEAIEHFDFNVAGSWMGDRTPYILTKVDTHGV